MSAETENVEQVSGILKLADSAAPRLVEKRVQRGEREVEAGANTLFASQGEPGNNSSGGTRPGLEMSLQVLARIQVIILLNSKEGSEPKDCPLGWTLILLSA